MELFKRGLRRGFLTVQEIEGALPPGALTAAERWLLYYCLREAEIQLRDATGTMRSVPALSVEERAVMAREGADERLSTESEAPHMV